MVLATPVPKTGLHIHVLDFIHAPERAGFAHDMHLQAEYNWMQTLKTMLPMGLNTMDRAPAAQYCRDVTSCTSRNKIVEVKSASPANNLSAAKAQS